MSARRASRQAALQALYAVDIGAGGEHFEGAEGARAFAQQLVAGVAEHLAEIDAVLTAHALNWRVERMAAVDRNVLRLAIWEICFGDTPPSVAIDEAVELARRFGGERSPAFVNGVLDAVARSQAAGREARA